MKLQLAKDIPGSSYGIQDWRHGTASISPDKPERSPEVSGFYQNLWPISEPYVSLLNPVFLLDLPSVAALGTQTHWLVRDGLLPLIWFFTKNPFPGGFKSVLRIHSDFEEFVPDAWRAQVELYEIVSDEGGFADSIEPSRKEVRELLLMGLIMPSVCSLPRLESDLKNIVSFIGGKQKLEQIKIRAFLPGRFESTDIFNGPSYYNRFMTTICRFLGTDIEFIEFESLKWMYSQPGTWAHEFNERKLYTDSYLSLLALSKGTRFIPIGAHADENQRPFEQVLPIYPHVSCGIRRKFTKPFIDYLSGSWVPETQERAKTFYRAMNSSANIAFPWPKWFASWCKDFSTF